MNNTKLFAQRLNKQLNGVEDSGYDSYIEMRLAVVAAIESVMTTDIQSQF